MSNKITRVQVVFFSGTGGTERIAGAFCQEVKKRNINTDLLNLGDPERKRGVSAGTTEADLYIILFPVYAFDAPDLVHQWINSLKTTERETKAAVISVSGGGEVWPNTGCRNQCCKELEEKGFQVVYDGMMCMPANMAVKINDHLAMWLIKAIPEKVNHIVDSLLTGRMKRTKFHKSPLRRYLTNLENRNANKFAHQLEISSSCRKCGWCVDHCPMQNIVLKDGETNPRFLDQCTVCLRCVYGCPFHAIQSKSSVIFQSGFDLESVEKRMKDVELMPVEACCKGILLKGVKKYLLDKV